MCMRVYIYLSVLMSAQECVCGVWYIICLYVWYVCHICFYGVWACAVCIWCV